jgi:hypothetical protein
MQRAVPVARPSCAHRPELEALHCWRHALKPRARVSRKHAFRRMAHGGPCLGAPKPRKAVQLHACEAIRLWSAGETGGSTYWNLQWHDAVPATRGRPSLAPQTPRERVSGDIPSMGFTRWHPGRMPQSARNMPDPHWLDQRKIAQSGQKNRGWHAPLGGIPHGGRRGSRQRLFFCAGVDYETAELYPFVRLIRMTGAGKHERPWCCKPCLPPFGFSSHRSRALASHKRRIRRMLARPGRKARPGPAGGILSTNRAKFIRASP